MAEAKESKTSAAVVQWDAQNTFETRTIQHRDWMRLGAASEPVTPDITWSDVNQWTVTRSEVPLNDEQLAVFLAREPKFSVREV